MTAATSLSTRAAGRTLSIHTVRLSAAGMVLLGTLLMGLGTSWDISWHARIGRDSFWIPPHVVVYVGTALVLLATGLGLAREYRHRQTELATERERTAIPRGWWLIAAGAIWFVAGAPFDDLWHRRFGLDVTIWSPPHLSLLAAAFTMLLGVLRLLREEQRRAENSEPTRPFHTRAIEWGLIGLALGFLVQPVALVILPAVRYGYVQPGAIADRTIRAATLAAGPWLLPILVAALAPAVLFLAPPLLRWTFGVSLPALVHLALRPLGAAFAELGYALTFPFGLPALAPFAGLSGEAVAFWLSFVPVFLVAPAVAADLVLLATHRGGGHWVLAAIAFALVVALQGTYAPTFFERPALPLSTLSVAGPILAVLAIASAWLGRWIGHQLAPHPA